MKNPLLAAVIVTSAFLAGTVRAELVVVVNADNPVTALTRDQVVDIYMGRRTHFPDGRPALPIDQGPDSPLRAAYYQKLVGKTVAQVNAYWARLLFTGRATPPRVLPDSAAVLDVVRANQDAIAYLDSLTLDDQVKVVYRLP